MARSSAGFTLLELILVMGLIAMLSGIGIGFLRGADNGLEITRAILRNQIRIAYETARGTGRPTSVDLVGDDEISFLRAKVLSTVGQWHLEPDELYFGSLDPVLFGIPESAGRFGSCLRPDLAENETMFRVATDESPRFDLRDGFALRLEVFLESRERCIVASLGETFSLELDEDLRPLARLALADGLQAGRTVDLGSEEYVLPLRRWVSLELVHDGVDFILSVDGEEVSQAAAAGEPYQPTEGQWFEVSPANSLVHGMIDEIQLLGYEMTESLQIPADVEIRGLDSALAYDRRGVLRKAVTIELVLGSRREVWKVAPGGVLE